MLSFWPQAPRTVPLKPAHRAHTHLFFPIPFWHCTCSTRFGETEHASLACLGEAGNLVVARTWLPLVPRLSLAPTCPLAEALEVVKKGLGLSWHAGPLKSPSSSHSVPEDPCLRGQRSSGQFKKLWPAGASLAASHVYPSGPKPTMCAASQAGGSARETLGASFEVGISQ